MSRARIGRRHLLRGAASTVVALPLLEAMGCDAPDGEDGTSRASSLGSAQLRAGELDSPQRFITLLVPNGTLREAWFPTGTPDSYELGPIMSDLSSHRDKLLILEGVDNPVADTGEIDGHREGLVSWLTGWGVVPGTGSKPAGGAGGISLDQHIAELIGGGTRRRSLELGTEAAGPSSSASFDRFREPLPRLTSPRELFGALFGDVDLDAEALAAVHARRASILDSVTEDYQRIHAKISGADRQRVEAHLDAIREVEHRMTIESSCEPPAQTYPDLYLASELPAWTKDMIDLLVLAMSCDLSRVASLVYRHPGGGVSYFPWLGLGADDNVPEHHQMTHEADAWVPELIEIFRWYTAQTGYLLERLEATPELDHSLLDSTLVFQGSECSDGSVHDKIDMPFLLAGTAGGRVATGKWLRFEDHRPHNELLVAIMNAFGIEGSCFGNPYFCGGPLPGVLVP